MAVDVLKSLKGAKSAEVLQIMADLKSGKMRVEDAALAIQTQIDRAARGTGGVLSCKVSRKGAVSVYGLQRMPVTLYAEQWERLLKGAPADHLVLRFITENEGREVSGSDRDGEYTSMIQRK